MEKFETKTPPNMIEFRHTSLADEWVMRITADRQIEVNEGVEVNDAAKKVLEAMQHMLTPQRTWVGLSQEDFIYFCSYVRSDVLSEIEAKLKELNT